MGNTGEVLALGGCDALTISPKLLALASIPLGGSFALLRLLGQEYGLNVGKHASLCDGNSSQKFIYLFVVPDGKLQVSRDYSSFLIVTSCIAGKLKNLSCYIFSRPPCLSVDFNSVL